MRSAPPRRPAASRGTSEPPDCGPPRRRRFRFALTLGTVSATLRGAPPSSTSAFPGWGDPTLDCRVPRGERLRGFGGRRVAFFGDARSSAATRESPIRGGAVSPGRLPTSARRPASPMATPSNGESGRSAGRRSYSVGSGPNASDASSVGRRRLRPPREPRRRLLFRSAPFVDRSAFSPSAEANAGAEGASDAASGESVCSVSCDMSEKVPSKNATPTGRREPGRFSARCNARERPGWVVTRSWVSTGGRKGRSAKTVRVNLTQRVTGPTHVGSLAAVEYQPPKKGHPQSQYASRE